MKNITILLLLVLAGISAAGRTPAPSGKNTKYPAVFREHIVVDGNAAEWPIASFKTNKEAYMAYSVANDSAAFYLCIKVKEVQQQMRVMRSGMEIWINEKGKKKKETGINFPLAHTLPPLDNRNMSTEGRPDPKKIRLMFLVQVKEMEVSGFREGCNGSMNNKSNKTGIMAVINWDSANVMIYEVRIPFSALNSDIHTLDHINIGMVLKGLSKPQGQPGENHMEDAGGMNDPQGGRGGMGGQRPGGMGQERPQYGMDDRNRLFEDVDIWAEAGIATKEQPQNQ